ncbi:MAG TPA: PKD-like family lipoprotein, partial [Parasegetibacter sp.]
MKNPLLYILVILAITLVACMKERGTYNHIKINEIYIDTIRPVTVQLGGKLEITPEISQSIEEGEDNLEYVWYWYKFGFTQSDTLSRERNLDITVPMRTDLGSYTTVFKVYDKNTGVSSKWTFNVTVTAAAAEGVLVLSNLDGNAELGILNTAKNYVGSLYYDANGEHPGKNPVYVGFTKVNAVPYLNAILIMCDDGNGGVVAHHMDFVKKYDYKKYFFVPPSNIKPQRYYN